MKIVAFALLATIIGYLVGFFGGMALVNSFSSNTHDSSVEAAMTAAFVYGPIVAVLACILTVVFLLQRGGA